MGISGCFAVVAALLNVYMWARWEHVVCIAFVCCTGLSFHTYAYTFFFLARCAQAKTHVPAGISPLRLARSQRPRRRTTRHRAHCGSSVVEP